MGIDGSASSTTSDISLSRSSSSISLGGSNQNQNVGDLNGSPVVHTQSSVSNSHHQQSSIVSKVKGFFEKIGHIAASPFNSLMGMFTHSKSEDTFIFDATMAIRTNVINDSDKNFVELVDKMSMLLIVASYYYRSDDDTKSELTVGLQLLKDWTTDLNNGHCSKSAFLLLLKSLKIEMSHLPDPASFSKDFEEIDKLFAKYDEISSFTDNENSTYTSTTDSDRLKGKEAFEEEYSDGGSEGEARNIVQRNAGNSTAVDGNGVARGNGNELFEERPQSRNNIDQGDDRGGGATDVRISDESSRAEARLSIEERWKIIADADHVSDKTLGKLSNEVRADHQPANQRVNDSVMKHEPRTRPGEVLQSAILKVSEGFVFKNIEYPTPFEAFKAVGNPSTDQRMICKTFTSNVYQEFIIDPSHEEHRGEEASPNPGSHWARKHWINHGGSPESWSLGIKREDLGKQDKELLDQFQRGCAIAALDFQEWETILTSHG